MTLIETLRKQAACIEFADNDSGHDEIRESMLAAAARLATLEAHVAAGRELAKIARSDDGEYGYEDFYRHWNKGIHVNGKTIYLKQEVLNHLTGPPDTKEGK